MTRRAVTPLALAALLLGLAALAGPAAAQHPNHARGFRPSHAFEVGGIENVNAFNGNVALTIPLGPQYPVGPELSYGFTLTYAGNVWQWDLTSDPNSGDEYLQADPRSTGNAGLGWEVGFGRYLPASSPDNPTDDPAYISPDQGFHALRPFRLHPGGETFASGTDFTQDGTYLRFHESTSTLDEPDGTTVTFGPYGPTRIEDPFGHGLTITYGNLNAGDPLLWTVTDDHGRSHQVIFERKMGRVVVTQVKLAAFKGAIATYTFHYDTTVAIPRACNYPIFCGQATCGNTSAVHVPLLTRVDQPDGSSYGMPIGSYHVNETTACPNPSRLINGQLERLELPTGGAYEWDWEVAQFPVESASLESTGPRLSPPQSPYRSGVAVSKRRHIERNGSELGSWTYEREINGFSDGFGDRELVVTETAPGGETTKSYFSVWAHPDSDPAPSGGWTEHEYGLPFTRQTADGSGKSRFLSRRVYNKDGGQLRRSYVLYERSGATNANPRLSSQRTVYDDDGGVHADVDYSSFDGLGHFRTMTTGGSFTGANTRTVTTDYNPGKSTSNIPDPTDPWVLGTFDQVTITEGSQTAVRELDFDEATGFLKRTRTRKSAARSGADVIVVRTQKPGSDPHFGFLAREDFYGGDGAGLPTGPLGQLDLTGKTIAYQRKHDYTCGVLQRSRWFVPNGNAIGFSSPDLDIDCASGLVETSRDTAGLVTGYSYDTMGRLTSEKPGAGEAETTYIITPESASSPAKVAIRRKSAGGAILAGGQLVFDGFGRVAKETRGLPGGAQAERTSSYTAQNELYARTEWHTPNAATGTTSFGLIDPFGRPHRVDLPDGTRIEIGYNGVGSRTVDVPIATGVTAGGDPMFTTARTKETYDRFGRLAQLTEPNDTRTDYSYDALDNLTRVEMNAAGTTKQIRTFTYDGRGFLTSETHPELGTAVIYSSFDPLGNPHRIRRGGWDLDYVYDAAGRLIEIRDHGTSGTNGLWKEWHYAADNSEAGPYGKGKLASAVRHNRVYVPGTTTEIGVPVTEFYTYGGVGGRISNVTTTVGTGDQQMNTRPIFYYGLGYDPLGNVTSRTYPDCGHLYCIPASPNRTVTATYDEGLLKTIPGYASSITYHPNGLVNQVNHSNGVSDLQENDPSDQPRPYRLRTSGASDDFDSGVFRYDGAGNVIRMGQSYFVYDKLSRVTKAEAQLEPDACSEDAHVESKTYFGLETIETCGEITAGPAVRITQTGIVTYRAGERIALGDGFQVDGGGRFVAEIDPAIEPTGGAALATWDGTYDRFGNLTEVTIDKPGTGPITHTMPVVASTNRLSGATYDTAGNVITWAGRSFRYDPFNMLRETGTHTFLYGPGDERIEEIDWTAGAAFASWDEYWTLRDLDGRPLRQLLDHGGNDGSGTWTFLRDYVWRDGALLATITPGGVQHFHLDHLGTPTLVTDASGNTLVYHSYLPFGEEATDPDDSAIPLQYTGHERDDLDPGAGNTLRDLDYMHRRFFSPHLGRFLSTDPLAGHSLAPQAFNLYGYTLGNPVKYTDPRGMWPFFPLGDIPYFDTITVIDQFIPLAPYNPLTGVQGLGDLLSGRSFLNSLSGPAPRGSRSSRGPMRSLMRQVFCPPIAQGISGDISTINPFTSGGGGSYGLNLQYVPGEGLALYGFATPNDIASVGFDVGGSLTINGAIGSGPWTGDFITAMGTVGSATFGGFGTPSGQATDGGIGFHGIQGGITGGVPFGLGATTTRFSKLADLSFLIPWCQ